MARAHRHYVAGQIWHLTHRCHQRQFLLKFARDRQAWIAWLFDTRCALIFLETSSNGWPLWQTSSSGNSDLMTKSDWYFAVELAG